jgi:hypothetical protein
MNTLKTVFGKLFKEETTNLATHKIELSLIEDAKKAHEEVKKIYNQTYWKTLMRLHVEVLNTIAVVKDGLDIAGKSQGIAIQKAREISNMSKELGVPIPKEIQAIFDDNRYDDMLESYNQDIDKIIKAAKK